MWYQKLFAMLIIFAPHYHRSCDSYGGGVPHHTTYFVGYLVFSKCLCILTDTHTLRKKAPRNIALLHANQYFSNLCLLNANPSCIGLHPTIISIGFAYLKLSTRIESYRLQSRSIKKARL